MPELSIEHGIIDNLVSILEPRLLADVRWQREHFGEETEGLKQSIAVLLKAKILLDTKNT
jgi:hypothetical protein